MKFKVFIVEFDGIDKAGKDSIMAQIFSAAPNKYIPKARGLLSQIAYAKLYNRDYEYEVTDGYLENTLFVYLTVDQEDWKIRCDVTREFEKNRFRSDMEGELKYSSNKAAFDYAYDVLENKLKNKKQIIKFNTSEVTPYKIITEVVKRLEELNEEK